MTPGTWFHAEQVDMRIGMAQAMNSKSSEILGWLAGSMEPMSKWIKKGILSRATCNMLRRVPVMEVFLMLLRRSVQLDMYV